MNKFRSVYIRLSMILTLLLIGVFGFVQSAKAVEIIEGESITADEVIDDDVFITGNTVVVDGTVNGDLFASGNTVTVNGTVKGSLVTAAQTIIVNGQIEGSIYAAGYTMMAGEKTQVGRNFYFAGFSLEAKPEMTVGRDLLMAVYQGVLGGEVGRDLLAAAGALEINGKVGGDVKVDIGAPDEEFNFTPMFGPPGAPPMIKPGLRVGEGAEIGGKLIYTSPADQTSAIDSTPLGGVVYQTPQPHEEDLAKPAAPRPELLVGKWVLKRLSELATLLVLGALAVWLIPGLFNQVVDRVRSAPLPAAGWGLVAVIVGYAGAGLLALLIITLAILLGVITLGGLGGSVFGLGFSGLGVAFTTFTLLVSYGSKILVSYLAGKLILQKLAPQAAENKYLPLVVGVVLYVLVRAIPLLGWIVAVIVTLVGVGAIWMTFQDYRRSVQPVAA